MSAIKDPRPGSAEFDAAAYLKGMEAFGSKFWVVHEVSSGKTRLCEDMSENWELTDAEASEQLRLCSWYRSSPDNKQLVADALKGMGLYYVV